ncbi:class A beta-lactamase-related serine hydrolase [Solibacillus sp. MA9]|uniref:Class A beta-lactamase-related serine hydrolase n=1 Tax=Solibacillus palustris TaxID=2908203 RepID=A0ABS9UI50_9BACL|nr:serine hydrolase [Solibacillus sp. MA9]MCH7324021.1 class A beta-lactamase-related serine hydrolase [Solibacillus sp. MA9]
MEKVLEKLEQLELGEVGIIIYSQVKQDIVLSLNKGLVVPLASAAKVAIAFCIAKLVEERHYKWTDIVEDIILNPKEDSHEVYPHFQNRENLALQDAVEVMIACHDSFVAERIVQFCGGWEMINNKIKSYFKNINITQNPRDLDNNGELSEMLELLRLINQGYKTDPDLWIPVINGLVRQRGDIEGIPSHLLNHMTGGLNNVVVDIGIMGEFSKNPLLFVLGAKELPNRFKEKLADEIIIDAMKLLYIEYCNQEVELEKESLSNS